MADNQGKVASLSYTAVNGGNPHYRTTNPEIGIHDLPEGFNAKSWTDKTTDYSDPTETEIEFDLVVPPGVNNINLKLNFGALFGYEPKVSSLKLDGVEYFAPPTIDIVYPVYQDINSWRKGIDSNSFPVNDELKTLTIRIPTYGGIADFGINYNISDIDKFEAWRQNTSPVDLGSQEQIVESNVSISFDPNNVIDEATITEYQKDREYATEEPEQRNTTGFIKQIQSANDPTVKYPKFLEVGGKKIIEPDTSRYSRVENIPEVKSIQTKKRFRVGKEASKLSTDLNNSGAQYEPTVEAYLFPVESRGDTGKKHLSENGNIVTEANRTKSAGWRQPNIPFNPTYPFNKSITTERGHILELDDSKDRERINIEHRSGTYTEIDANGSRVNRIVGDGFEIFERNNQVLIKGACNVTVIGNSNVKVEGNTTLQTLGAIKIQGNAAVELTSNGKMALASRNGIDLIAEKGDIRFISLAGKIQAEAKSDVLLKSSGGKVGLNAKNRIDLKADSTINMDGSKTIIQTGTATNISAIAANSIPKPLFIYSKSKMKPRKVMLSTLKELKTLDEVSTHAMYETPEENRRPENLVETDYAPIPETEIPVATSAPTDIKKPEVEEHPEYTETECGIEFAKLSQATKMSPNLTFGYFNVGESGLPKPADIHYGVTGKEIICNLKGVANNIIEPILKNYPNARITSAWRSESVNKKYNGSTTSDHLTGKAVDIQFAGFSREETYAAAVAISKWNDFHFKQLILEYKGTSTWLHISYDVGNNRNEVLTMDAATNRVLARNNLQLYT